MLTMTRQMSLGAYKHETDFEDKKKTSLAAIKSARSKVQAEIAEMKSKLELAKTTSSKFKDEIMKVQKEKGLEPTVFWISVVPLHVLNTECTNNIVTISYYLQKMLVCINHANMLQSSMELQQKDDKNLHFFCSDGDVVTRSTCFKIHSKFLRDIFSDIPAHHNDISLSLPDVPVSNLAHLWNILSSGCSNFSANKVWKHDNFFMIRFILTRPH